MYINIVCAHEVAKNGDHAWLTCGRITGLHRKHALANDVIYFGYNNDNDMDSCFLPKPAFNYKKGLLIPAS